MTIKLKRVTRTAVLAKMANGAELTDEENQLLSQTESESDTETPEAPEVQETPVTPEVTETPAKVPDTDLVSEFAKVTKANAKLEAKVEDLEAKLTESEQTQEDACNIVRTSVERLAVALNSTVVGLEDARLSTLCAHFSKLNKEFEKRFAVGAKSTAVVDDKQVSQLNDELAQRTKAARQTTNRRNQ